MQLVVEDVLQSSSTCFPRRRVTAVESVSMSSVVLGARYDEGALPTVGISDTCNQTSLARREA